MGTMTAATVIARYFAATRTMDVEAWLSCFAEDAVSYDPAEGPPLRGKAALRQFFLGVGGLFRHIGFTEGRVYVNGARAAVTFSGSGEGKNGRRVTFDGIDVFEFNEQGFIHTMWGYWQPGPVLAAAQEPPATKG